MKYKKQLTIVLVVIVVVVIVYLLWRKADSTTIKVVDDNGNAVSFTTEQTNHATAIADRIFRDLNSGLFFGWNLTGFGPVESRDVAAYQAFAQMSDSMFALTCRIYQQKNSQGVIADLRAEGSIVDEPQIKIILEKATRLNIA